MTSAAPDLYTHLGVPCDASHADIRGAFRRRAKSDHPDAGGSQAKFSMTKLAHDILTDPNRRARYDSTGDCSESAPDNTHAQLLEVLSALLAHTLDNCAKSGVDPLTIPFAREMESLAANSIRDFEKSRAKLTSQRAQLERLIGRFKRRGTANAKAKRTDPPEPNQLEAIVRGTMAGLDSAITQLDGKIAKFREAIEVIKAYDFTADPRRMQAFVQVFNAGSGTGNSAW
jgi:curved DNA-binding protein CbpA